MASGALLINSRQFPGVFFSGLLSDSLGLGRLLGYSCSPRRGSKRDLAIGLRISDEARKPRKKNTRKEIVVSRLVRFLNFLMADQYLHLQRKQRKRKHCNFRCFNF